MTVDYGSSSRPHSRPEGSRRTFDVEEHQPFVPSNQNVVDELGDDRRRLHI
jgi:hypothetical protein